MRRFIVIAPAEYLAAAVYPRQCLPVGERNIEPNDVGIVPEPAIDQVEQRVASITGRGRQSNALQITHLLLLQTVPCRRIEQVDLVEGLDQPFLDRLTEAESS